VIFVVYPGILLNFCCPCYTRYEEDVLPGNHDTIWGSYWRDGQWGYQCCNSTIKNSYCTGYRGKDINGDKDSESALMQPLAIHSTSSSGTRKAQKKKMSLLEADRLLATDERKRHYNSMIEVQPPSEVEMDVYYMERKRDEDPMAHFM
jgi:pre-mRNA-processing factor SLU7